MKVNYVLLISLLIVGALFVPAVSAQTENLSEFEDITLTYTQNHGNIGVDTYSNLVMVVSPIESFKTSQLKAVEYNGYWRDTDTPYTYLISSSALREHQSYAWDNIPLKVGATEVGRGTLGYYRYGAGLKYVHVYLHIDEFNPGSLTGTQKIKFDFSGYDYSMEKVQVGLALPQYVTVNPTSPKVHFATDYSNPNPGFLGEQLSGSGNNFAVIWNEWKCNYEYDTENVAIDGFANLYITRTVDGKPYTAKVTVIGADGTVLFDNTGSTDLSIVSSPPIYQPMNLTIENPATGTIYNRILGNTSDPGGPGDPTPTQTEEPTGLRTGTVTMTDNNGTSITGFEVTAVNAYTGKEYTVSTESDVAVMTLPMDQSIRIRNPQTGVYEDTLVGYYRFYGQAPGYKMLYDGGIQVSVVPEKYSTYELCDIRVTSESGYLTGTHQFQIRSRSDNSILQTGTLSAKSATTGEWFNTTVSGGIATLILPYDTSNSISQYAGNYYVYATSPGYEDSDYGTQIVVMPHTVSEIRDVLLTPIGGVPTPGNVTLRIQAFSETGPGVVNAEIFIAGVLGEGSSVWDTYTASSTGYLAVSVPGNSTYDIVASGAGYYDSAQRIEVFTEDPPLIEMKLYLSGAPTLEPPTQPTGWITTQPTTQPTGGIPDEDDDSEGFLMQAVRGIGLAFGVGFATAKLIFGMLLALSIGYATAKQLRGGAAEFGLGLLGGTLLGVLIGLLPVWIIVVLLLVVGLYIGNRYVGGGNNG